MTAREYILPDPAAVARYAEAIMSAPSSLLPGLSGIEAAAAMSYARTLPMRRDQSVVDVWAALDVQGRDEWVARTRAEFGGDQ